MTSKAAGGVAVVGQLADALQGCKHPAVSIGNAIPQPVATLKFEIPYSQKLI